MKNLFNLMTLKLRRFGLALSGVLMILPVVSCGVGLGDSVDTEAPKIQIEYPPVASVIRKEFVLSGTWDDDKAVSSIKVSIIDTSSKKEKFSGMAEVKSDKTWSIRLNDFDESNSAYFNGWQFADGAYQVSVTAMDAAGHSTGDSRSFEIDNTPPVFVIQKPGVVKSSANKCSKYGSIFSVEGTIADDHEISKMDLLVYDAEGNLIKSEPYSETNVSTVGGTSVQIARYVEGGTDVVNTRYNEIYGDDVSAEDKIFYCTVTLSDSAKIYQNSEDNGVAEGNPTSIVYLYDDVYDEYMSPKKGAGLTANEFKKILNKTLTEDDAISTLGPVPKTVPQVTEALGILGKNTAASDSNYLKFSLNPNADPTYLITGYTFNSSNLGANKEASANQPLTAVISAGRDGTLIEPSKIKVWFRELENTVAGDESKLRETIDSLVKQVKTAEGKSEPVDFDAEIQDWQLLLDNSSDPATSDSSVTVQFEVPEDIGLNKYYIIVVTGHDKDDTYISQNVHYGFIGSVQGTPPSVSFTSPSNLSTVKSTASDVLSVSGSAVEKISGMYIKKLEVSVEVSDQATSKKLGTLSSEIECSQFNVAADSAVWTSGSGFECVYRNGENIFTVTPEFMEGYDAVKADEGSGKSYQYDVSIKAVSVSKNETVANLTVFVDSVLPVVSINSITPTVSGADFNSPENTYVNGTITVKGNVEETNLKEVLLDVYVDGKLIENFSENLGKIYSFSKDIDTTKLEDNKDIDIRITARDKVGNETVYSSKTSRDENGKDSVYKNLVILQETDRPVIIVRNASVAVDSSEKINTNANLFGTTSNNVLQLQFSDDDSVTQYKIYLYDEAGKPFENPKYESSEHIVTPETKTTTVSEQYVLPPEPGVYRIKIEARDWLVTDTDTDASHPNGIGSTGEFFVAVDTGSPVISVASPSNGAYVLGEFEVRGEVSPTAKKFENGTRISASFVDMDENVLDPQPADFTPVYEDGKTSWTGTSWKGKIKLKEGESGNKAYYVLFTATDKYGQSNSTTLKFNIDMDPPVLEPVDPTQTIVLSDTQYINLNAVSSDSYSGLSGVYYYATVDASATVTKENFDSVRWVQMNQGASSYNATVNLADLIQNDGEIYIWFGAADNANNRSFSPTKYILTTDLKIPEIKVSYTKGSEIFVNENEKINSNANPNEFKAVVADTNIKTFTCENENVKITLDQDKSTDSEKIYTVKVTNGDDDTQNVVLVAEDECGKKKEFAFSVTCDTVPPVVVVDEYAESIGTNSFTLTGTVYEKNLKDINFCLKNDDSSKNKTATVTTTLDPSDPSDSSGNTRKFTAKFFEVTDGDYNVTLLVDDMFGNKTETASKALNDGTTVELKPVNFDSVSPVSSIKLSQKNEYKLLDNSLSHAEVGGKTTGETDSTYVLYEENPAPANRIDGNLYTNAENEFVLSGTIVEGNFNSATISLNGADPLNLQNDEGDLTAEGEWKYEQKKKEDTEFDGSYRYTITVLDKAGHKFEKTFTVIVDTKAPDFEITSPVDQQSFSNAPEIKGTWSDDGIGIKNLTYAVYNITETSTLSDSNKIVGITENRGAATWSLTLPDSFKDEGTFKVVASANDYFGKECDSKESVFYYDTQNPELTEKLTETGDTYTSGVGENGRTTNASFSLAGTVSDTNALFGFVAAKGTAEESVVIKTIVIGEEKTYTAKTVASNKHSADWNYDFVVGDENNTAKNYLPDGNYTFTVIAKDIAGKTYQLSRTVRVDTEAPKFGNGPADSKDTSYDAKNVIPHVTTTSKTVVTDSGEKIWYNTTDLRIAGTASDNNGTGIAGVYYETSTDGSNWSGRADMAGSTSWSGTISGLESTKTRVKITVTDNAGNSLPKELGPWNIDTTKPALSENSVMVGVNETLTDADKKSSILANGTKDIYLSGKVEDEAGGSGIAAVYILPYNSTSYADKDKAKVTADGTFTFTIPMADIKQSGSVYARIFDGAGNYSDANLFSINFDNVAPTVKMNNPKDADNSTDGIQVNGIISIEGTASDNNTLQKIERIECSTDNGTNWKKLVTTAEFNDLSDKTDYQDAGENFAITGSYSWTASGIDTTKFTDNSTVKFRAVALDTAENEGWYEDDAKSRSCEIVLNINQNTDRPTVKVTSINKIGSEYFLKYGTNAQISGSISDDDSTSSNVVKVFKASDKEIELDADGKIVTSSLSGETTFTETTGEWTFQPSDIDDGSKTVYFYMEDNAGKVFVTASSDVLSRPYFQYKTDTKEDNETSVSYKSDSKSPVIADTNANDSKDGTTANKTDSADNVAALMASYVVGGSEKKHIRFNIKATDASGIAGIAYNLYYTTGSGNTLTTHYVSNKATNYTEDGGKKYIGGVELAETSSCIYVLDNSSYTAEGTEASWTTGFVDISSVPTGSITLNVTPYDKAGLTGNQSYTFAVDNSGPTIKINAPIKNSQVTGEFAIEGSAIDSGSASTENIQWLVPSKAELTIANAITSDSTRFEYLKTLKWNGGERSLADGATVSSWKFEFDGKYDAATSDVTNKIFKAGNPKFDVYDSESYATNTDYASTGLYYLPVYFMATDKLGNYTIMEDYILAHNPDADKPKVEFTYPTISDYSKDESGTQLDYVVLGGTIRVTGSGVIPSGTTTVKEVFYQIANESKDFTSKAKVPAGYEIVNAYTVVNRISGTNYSSSNPPNDFKNYGFSSKTEMDAWWGIKATGTASWNVVLNKNGELDPTDSNTTNNVTLRACGVNAEGKFGAWTTGDNVISIHIDNTAPTITASVNQYSNGTAAITAVPTAEPTASQTYESDMFLKGKWTLVLEVLDETSVNSVSVKKGNSNLTDGTDFFKKDVSYTSPDKKGYQVYIPISNEESKVEYTVTALDSEHTASQSFSFNIDEIAPTLDSVTGNGTLFESADFTSIENNNYVFTVAGKSMDEGSGVERIVFYYMRKSGTTKTSITNEVVLDPMITTGTDDSKVALSTLTERTFTQGEKTYSLYAKEYSGTATTDEFTATGTYDSHVRVGGLVEIDGVLRKITKIEGTKIEFTPSLSKAKETFTAYFPIAQVIDNSATEKTLSDSANPFTFEKGDDGDLMPESFSKSGKTWTWDASIHSDNMSDGPVSLVILAFDAAGNVNGKTVNTKITNNAPRIAKVWFGTDLSGDGKFSNSDSLEELLEYNILGAEGKEQSAYTLDFTAKDDKNQPKFPAGLFTIKNRLAVVPEFTGGNGEIGMVASTTATSADAVQGTVTAKDGIATIVTGTDENGKTVNTTGRTLSSTVTGTFTASNESNAVYSFIPTALPTDGTNKGMSFTFWDSTDETTQGQDSQNSVLYVKNFTVNQTDNIAPTVVINPFWWNKIDDNSIYDSASASKFSDLKGHIELERDWIATDSTGKKLSGWDGNTSETYLDSDPKVSGKVRFTGTAYDNVRLKSIAITFSNISGTDVATYDKTNSSWTVPATTLETEGYVFSVSDAIKDSKGNKVLYGNYEDDVYFGQKGHKIYWTLDIDTAKITGVAAKDISLIVKATDAANKTTADSTISNLTDDKTARIDVVDGTTNVSSYRVDVVPYITEVTTALSALSKKTPTMYSRTALGHYPVRIVTKKTNGTAGTFAENVTLSGFNLGENTTLDVSTLTTAEDSRTGGKSAAFSVTVNGISSLNNVNNNNARGSYETEITNASKYSEKSTYAYNRQPNNANNNLLTDDVYFDVWEFNSAAAIPISGKIEQPVMKIRPTDGKIGFAFVNGPLYFSMGGSESSQDYSYQYWSGSFDFFTSVGFTYDKLGNSYGVAAGGDINSYTADKFCFMTSRFGIGEHGQNGMYNAQNALRLESIGYNIGGTPSFDKQRIKSPSLATTTHGNATNVYLSYYDSMSDEVRFKAGTFNETTDSDWVVTQLQYTDSKNNGWRYGWVYVPEGTVPNGSEFYFCDKDGNNVAAKDADGNVVFESGTKHYTRGRYPGNVNDRKFCFRIDEETENDAKTFPIGQYNQDNNGNQNRTPKDLIYLKIKVSNIRVTGNIKDYDINSMYNYRNDKVSMIAMGDSSPSFPENGTVTRPAGEYVSLGVVSKQGNEVDDVVVATWYGSDRTLYYSYNNTPFTDRSGDTAFTGWSTPVAVFSDKEYENAGEYCKVSVDANGGVHIAAYDPVNLDLVYAYSESATSPSFKTAVVDANGVVGSNLTLDVALVDGKPVPYIGYYATSCIKPKYARFVGDWSAASIDGSIDDEITGNWEISVVPSAEVIEMQSNQHNDINIGVWKNGSGVLIDNATDSTHYVTGTSEISNTPNSYNSNSYGQCYGNGTKNPVLGYAVKNGASGDTIETAQMK